MTTDFVLAYVRRKMREMLVGDNYLLEFRHVVVPASGKVNIDAQNEFYYLVDGFSDMVRIDSTTGRYDLTDGTLSENMHEHSGKITITNRDTVLLHLQFVVAVPLYETQKPEGGTVGEGPLNDLKTNDKNQENEEV